VDVADWSNDGSPDLLSFYTQGDIRIWRNCDTLGVVTRAPIRELPHDAFAVVPNPTEGAFVVNVQAATHLSIHNAQEQLVWRQRIGGGHTRIDAPLAKGVYLVRLDGIARAQRLVVE